MTIDIVRSGDATICYIIRAGSLPAATEFVSPPDATLQVGHIVHPLGHEIARHAHRIAMVARRYAYRRLETGRRATEYQMYERLFSLWHVLHIPLFFMLLIAGIAHVVAVNVY